MISKPLMRLLLLVWAVLLIVQYVMAAVFVWRAMSEGMPMMTALTSTPPVFAAASLGLFLLMVMQYKNRQ